MALKLTDEDRPYSWGHPDLYLTPLELRRCIKVKAMVQVTLQKWGNVPELCWPIAEDLTSAMPGWLLKPTVETTSAFNDD